MCLCCLFLLRCDWAGAVVYCCNLQVLGFIWNVVADVVHAYHEYYFVALS